MTVTLDPRWTSHPAASSAEVEILRGHNNIGIASSAAYATFIPLTHFSHSLTHFCPLGHDLLLSLCPLKEINKLEIPSYQMSRLSILIVCRKIYRNTIICLPNRPRRSVLEAQQKALWPQRDIASHLK